MYEKRLNGAGNAQLLRTCCHVAKIFSIDHLIAKFYFVHPLAYRPNCRPGPIQQATEGLKNWEDAGIKTLVAVIKSQHYSFFR